MSKAAIIKAGDSVIFGMPVFEHVMEAEEHPPAGQEKPAIEEIERAAYENGFAAGEKAGFEMGNQKAAVLLNKLEHIILEVEEYKKQIVSELQTQILDLASEIAKRIVLEELTVKPEIMINIVKESIRRVERTGPITIKLNPSVQELFTRMKPALLDMHPDIIFDLDPSLPPTGQIIIGASEEVVTDPNVQVDNIIEDIRGGSGCN